MSRDVLSDQFTALAELTKIVADTGDIAAIAKYKPTDATTNPSLLLQAASMKEYEHLVNDSIAYGKGKSKDPSEVVSWAMDRLFVNFGAEIAKIVPGVVSTEVDARLSFDTQATIAKARRLIDMYQEVGVDKSRILIKIAATWEGIRAAEVLEKEGIACNMTLLFSLIQAAACAEAGATLISPFVGRITDWYKQTTGTAEYKASEDPGVLSVKRIFKYYKGHGYKTTVMGASFRNKGQIVELAGCDKLTIAPKLLEELRSSKDPVPRVLNPEAKDNVEPKLKCDEASFRWLQNEDAMATEKLAEGIRKFAVDAGKLETIVESKMKASTQ